MAVLISLAESYARLGGAVNPAFSHAKCWRAFGMSLTEDADIDGILDWWEQQYFGSNANCGRQG